MLKWRQIITKKSFTHVLKWTAYSSMAGLLAGVSSVIFLKLLKAATEFRSYSPIIIWALPLAGFFIGWCYYTYGREIEGGNNLVLDEIHNPRKVIPFIMTPFVLLGTVLTHLFGGSAGREGTAVQMGASLSDQISRLFDLSPSERKILLTAGTGAGFGAAIGAPWAGVIFGMEVVNVGKLRLHAWYECLISSFTAYYIAQFLNAPHTYYPQIDTFDFNLVLILCILLAGCLFGLAARGFSIIAHYLQSLFKRYISYPPLRPFVGGMLLIFFYWLEGSYRYSGLGLEYIQEALSAEASFKDPFLKAFFTSLTVSSGFKGGEFIPLVFIGSTLGSALGILLPVSHHLLGALGFAAVFGGAANAPLACTIMAMEIFGYKIGPYAFTACFMSYYLSGNHGIYSSQIIERGKGKRLRDGLKILGELPGKFRKKN